MTILEWLLGLGSTNSRIQSLPICDFMPDFVAITLLALCHFYKAVDLFSLGLIIYFSYGWWHSKEANTSGEFDPLVQTPYNEADKEAKVDQ